MSFVVIVIGYLLGSIPTAYIAGRLLRNKDIRILGDGNSGAQNASRQLGPKIGFYVGLLDATKGALAIIIAQVAALSQLWILVVGIAAVLGHNWPVFLSFKGGRGESTTIGILLVLVSQPILISGAFAAAALIRTRNVIFASMILFIPLPFISWWFGISGALISYSVGLSCLVGITHYVRTKQEVPLPVPD